MATRYRLGPDKWRRNCDNTDRFQLEVWLGPDLQRGLIYTRKGVIKMFQFAPTEGEWAHWMRYQLLISTMNVWDHVDSLVIGVYLDSMEATFEIFC